uniref:DUF3597 domain-containing protein n=1 Tax=Mycena chlorophos TaxID=658473 RepID=A0ABQ0LAZ2_MYCCL|nr:predicted protein [Mycena chlorophos]
MLTGDCSASYSRRRQVSAYLSRNICSSLSTPCRAAPAATTPLAVQQPGRPTVPIADVLDDLNLREGRGLDWRNSIVDLLKLLDFPFSLDARKTLADALNIHVAAPGTAAQNMALHRAVLQQIASGQINLRMNPGPQQPSNGTPSGPAPPEDVLMALHERNILEGRGLDWQHSIVDLLKLLNHPWDIDARAALAEQLGVQEGAHGSAAQNMALHKAVINRLAGEWRWELTAN